MTDPTWSNTSLWSRITRITADTDPLRAILVAQLSEAETILRAAGTSPSDFTLHDSDHSFRVAETMPKLVSDEVTGLLSRYELALLLCAAYLHDIGMTPAQGLVQAVFDYVFAGSPDRLDAMPDGPLELETLSLWLAERHPHDELPLNRDGGTSHSLALARSMVAHYARSRHDVWSSRWITEHFDRVELDGYPQFVDDLDLLCRSHHYGYAELAGDAFVPRVLGGAAEVVHLRFLAAMLRVADVLDVDPERTPNVVFRHRDVSPASALFWYKDHELSIFVRESQVVMHARPTEARVHRAVEQTADDIDRELALCRRLDEQTHFNRAPWTLAPLPHQWTLGSVAVRDISPREGTYEYINGAFRIDTDRILSASWAGPLSTAAATQRYVSSYRTH